MTPDRLFPHVERDTVIAQTFRWFLDRVDADLENDPEMPFKNYWRLMDEDPRRDYALRTSVLKRDLMDVYHAYSKRTTDSRSSFSNNLGRYTHGEDFIICPFIYEETALRKDGKPRTRAVGRWVGGIGRVLTGERKNVTRSRDRVQWTGPNAAAWLASLSDQHLDRALALMERRFTSDLEATIVGVRRANQHAPKYTHEPIDERQLAQRWLARINAEIARKDANAHAA